MKIRYARKFGKPDGKYMRFFELLNFNIVIDCMSNREKGKVFIGTSGYSYNDWLGNFYPQFCPKPDFLRFYSSVFKTVELNATYYRIPTETMVKKWYNQTPNDFVFTAKFPSAVTHEGSMNQRRENCKRFLEVISLLDDKLAVLLMQFPYGFTPDKHFKIMEQLIDCLPSDKNIAVEVRNRKWLRRDFYDLLKEKDCSLVQVDHPWMPKKSEFTADFGYIRLLGNRKEITDDFSGIRRDREDDLKWWSLVIEEFTRVKGDIYIYVNNHYSGHSPTTAVRLNELINNM
jgi:uncharacterized protein YecE (DUF72 family)